MVMVLTRQRCLRFNSECSTCNVCQGHGRSNKTTHMTCFFNFNYNWASNSNIWSQQVTDTMQDFLKRLHISTIKIASFPFHCRILMIRLAFSHSLYIFNAGGLVFRWFLEEFWSTAHHHFIWHHLFPICNIPLFSKDMTNFVFSLHFMHHIFL